MVVSNTSPLSVPLLAALAVLGTSALTIFAVAAAEGDALPIAILLAAMTLPIVFLVGAQTLVWNERYAFYAAIVILILQCATFRVREISDKSIDLQVLIKLSVIASFVALAMSATVRSWARRGKSEVSLWLCFFLYYLAISSISVQPQISFVENFSNFFAFLYIYNISRIMGTKNLASIIISACYALCLASIVAYFFIPQLGRMSDWVNGVFVPTSRLTGVFGTANAAGAAASIGIMLTVLFSNISPRRPLFYMLIVPMAFCLIVSNNRMSLAAMGISFFYVYLMRGHIALKLAIALLLLAIGALVFVSFGDTIMTGLSRSGSADEITSGTGRTRIWAVVIDLWLQRPLFGYGPGSAKFILPVHPMLFKAAAHPHNMYLSVLFAGGLVGITLFLTSLVMTLRRAWAKQAHAVIALVIFYLIYGVTEPVLGGMVSFLSFSFYVIPCFLLSDQPDPRSRASQPAKSPFRYLGLDTPTASWKPSS